MLHPAIVVDTKNGIQGKGLFATDIIREGTVVWQLTEPTYTWQDIQSWSEERFKAFEKYGFQCGVDRYSLPEGRSKWANHSCDPNTQWFDSDTIVARRDINVGEEVTYDYASCDIDLEFEMTCECSAPGCRQRISNRDHLDTKWQQQYGQNLPPHALAAIGRARLHSE